MPERRKSPLLSFAAALACAAALTLTGCFGIAGEPQTAATVNGDAIHEDDVTDYIEGFRSKNQEYETDSGWAEFLISNSYTAETIRERVLDEVFVPKLLIRQQCAERGIALTDEQLDGVIQREKDYYEGRYGENSWKSVLASYGYDEDSWRENESDRLLEEQLENQVVKSARPTQGEFQDQVNSTAANYSGKHSWHVEFASEDEARDARARLAPDDAGKTTLKRFRKLFSHAENAGWSSLAADREKMSASYVNVLNDLGKGRVSEPVQMGEAWTLVFCDAVFKVGKDEEYVSTGEIPSDILAQLREDARQAKRDKKFRSWLRRVTERSRIVVEPMPEGLPYAVNVALDDRGGK